MELKKISFDFDGTLRTYDGKDMLKTINTAKELMRKGNTVVVITRRNYLSRYTGINGEEVVAWVKEKLGDVPVFFTDGFPKFRTILNEGVQVHYDDDENEIAQLENDYLKNYVEAILIGDDKTEDRKKANDYAPLKDLSDKKILIVDSGGLYTSFAIRLSKEFGQVYYYNEWKGDMFNSSHKEAIGQGIPGVTKVEDIAEVKQIVDVVFYPDCNKGKQQMELISQGINVFGSGMAAELENKRGYFKKKMDAWGLPNVPYTIKKGIDELLEFLKFSPPKYIKISDTREDMETYGHKNFINTKRKMEDVRRRMGIRGNDKEFVVEDELNGCEIGIDTYCVLGSFPKMIMGGYEIKDSAYCGVMCDIGVLPQGMKDINDKMSEHIAENGVATFISTEERVADRFYLTDPTMRCPCPPNECQQANWMNIGEIIYEGARGNVVEPIYRKKYVAQIILKSRDVVERWLNITFPFYYANNIFFFSYCQDSDGIHCVPQGIKDHDVVCSVVGLGDTLDQAIEECLKVAAEVRTDGLKYNSNSFDEAKEVIAEGETHNIKIF